MTATRIDRRFAALKAEGRGGLITFITAGDPDYETSMTIVKGLPGAGADLIELGMPFTDPMADGPAVQAAGQRALSAGHTTLKTLEMVRTFREQDDNTPIILMGYFNPIFVYGVETFVADAKTAGVDGLIIVDLPPEEDEELCLPALKAGLNFIRLATPTTDSARLPKVLQNTSGFVYYVSMTGVTGTKSADEDAVAKAVARIKEHTDLPIAVGFGIKTPEAVAQVSQAADAAVVGSAIIDVIADNLDKDDLTGHVLSFVKSLSDGARGKVE